jgi:hypothetical protein
MSRYHQRPRRSGGALTALAALVAATAWAAGQPPAGESALDKQRKLLDQTISVDFQQTTLGDALEVLRNKSKLNITVDQAPWANQGIIPEDQPVRLRLTNVKVRTVLRRLLEQMPPPQEFDPTGQMVKSSPITYVFDDDVLVITTEDRAVQRQLRQRVSLDLDKVPLQKALRDLARETGANIVLDARQAKPAELPVTLRLTEVPLETAVRVLAESAGLRAVRMSNVLFVTSREVATEIRKEEETARQQELLELLQRLFGIPGGPAGGLVR